ncbi:hypothetical protein [Glycomyces sp. YM15]|uniref:hypothetical protein n=1 Tax=Glycomyces sp. YM15 TaxID=2800446 RepID=UPI001966CB32|nr:hypothetical protein [Glycomyces sp. YM15]
MFKAERTDQTGTEPTTKTWRTVVIGAAVPLVMLAGAPAVSAAEIETVETAQSEQLPPLPVDPPAGLPDPAALLDLQGCLTELQGLIAQLPPPAVPDVPAEAEQLPPLPDPGTGVPDVPDVSALTEVCRQVVEVVKGLLPPVEPPPGVEPPPVVEPPVDDPGLPVPVPGLP